MGIVYLGGVVNVGPGLVEEVFSDMLPYQVNGRLFYGHRVTGGQYPNILKGGWVGLVHAVALFRDVYQEVEEDRLLLLPLKDGQTVLGHLLLQVFRILIPGNLYRLVGTYCQTLPTADTFPGVNDGVVFYGDGPCGAKLGAESTGLTLVRKDFGYYSRVHGQFAAPGGQSHTDVL